MNFMDSIAAACVAQGQVLAWWLGQGGFAFKNAQGGVIFCDPYLSDSVREIDGPDWPRLFPPPLLPHEVRADAVIATHDHLDHADPHTLPGIMQANPSCLLAGPGSVLALAREWGLPPERLIPLERGSTIHVAGFAVHARFADHTADSISVVIESDGVAVAHTGDGLYHPRLAAELAELAPAALIAVINGKLGNMGAQDAARLAVAMDAPAAVPCHYGMFERNTVDPQKFVDALASQGRPARVRLPAVGRPLVLISRNQAHEAAA